LIHLYKIIRFNRPSLLIAGFIGIFLSIPFLPPIDGGSRFYASTMPFFLALLAVGMCRFSREINRINESGDDWKSDLTTSRSFSIGVIALTLIAPLVIFSIGQKPVYNLPVCPAQQEPFVIELHPGSYIDLVKDKSADCGLVPDVCFNDFEKNNVEKNVDDYYQQLFSLLQNDPANARILSAIDWVQNQAHYFYIPHDKLRGGSSSGLISGCADEITTQYQSIYEVKSILPGVQ